MRRRLYFLRSFAGFLLFFVVSTFLPSFQSTSCAQTNISGEIAGLVIDSSGAVIPNAGITLLNELTGQSKSLTSGPNGEYRVLFLPPGTYELTVSAAGFEKSKFPVSVFAGIVSSGDVKLRVRQSTTTITVTSSAPLLDTTDAQTSTSFDLAPVQALPNPGNDLTFFAQMTPGAIMNTQGGSGKFSVFGLPAVSNTITLNGGDMDDPYNNENHSGASNLMLGNNEISSISVIANAYDAAFGGLAGIQMNEITRAGSDRFHGNANYWWNGDILNANDWFNNNAPPGSQTPRPFDNSNEWATALGGPIIKGGTFFFVDYEGFRVVLPVRGTVYAPSSAYQSAVLSTTPLVNSYVPDGNLASNNNSDEAAQYQTIFSLFNNAAGAANASPTSNPDIVSFNSTASAFTSEYLISSRVDQLLGKKDTIFVHYKFDDGLQASTTNLLSPIFSSSSPQPQDYWELNETHRFSPNIANQFLYTGSWNRDIFSNLNQAAADQIAPFTLVWSSSSLMDDDGSAEEVGGSDYSRPQGRVYTGMVLNDDLSWALPRHTIKMGWLMRRDDISDHVPAEHTVTPENYTSLVEFGAGYSTRFRQTFSVRNEEPVDAYVQGAYIQDQWKPAANLTITYGVRLEYNSNPICVTNCFSNFISNFLEMTTETSESTPYDQMIQTGRHRALNEFQKISYEPRFGVAWLPSGPDSRTTVRGGFGLFSDSFPLAITNDMLLDPPNSVSFYIQSNHLLASSLPGSAAQIVAASNVAFRTNYGSGGSFASISASVPGFVTPTFDTMDHQISYPTYAEYSLTIEHQFPHSMVASAFYVGNHGYHELVSNDNINAYSSAVTGLPAAPPSPGFSTVTEINNAADSNYNGLSAYIRQRLSWLQYQVNYTYGHALDEISNGGLEAFGADVLAPNNPYNLSQNYGNADYDVRQNVSGSYSIALPHIYGPKVLVNGWQLSGTVFHKTGFPFSVVDDATPANYGAASIFADQLAWSINRHCGGARHAGIAAIPCVIGTPGSSSAGFANFGKATGFNVQRRNQFYGSGYTDTDLSLLKEVQVPHREGMKLLFGVQSFNLFNHPNFAQPVNDVESGTGAGGLGTIVSAVSAPTSVLGEGLGGDAAPRLFQLKVSMSF